MRRSEAFVTLDRLGVPAVTTAEAAAALELSPGSASKMLGRLADDGLMTRLGHGEWAVGQVRDPFALAATLTQPYPSYISLASALRAHGMITQVPRQIQVVSLRRPGVVTAAGNEYRIHQVAPPLFGGYALGQGGFLLATPEKAIFDTAYLEVTGRVSGRGRPEIEIPVDWNADAARGWAERIASASLRRRTCERVESIIAGMAHG